MLEREGKEERVSEKKRNCQVNLLSVEDLTRCLESNIAECARKLQNHENRSSNELVFFWTMYFFGRSNIAFIILHSIQIVE